MIRFVTRAKRTPCLVITNGERRLAPRNLARAFTNAPARCRYCTDTPPSPRRVTMAMRGGRFDAAPNELVAKMGESVSYDKRMQAQDIAGSTTHARKPARQGIIGEDDASQIVLGLAAVKKEIERGMSVLSPALEDTDMNIEHTPTDLIGAPSAKRQKLVEDRAPLSKGQLQVPDSFTSVRQGIDDFQNSIEDQVRKESARFVGTLSRARKESLSELAKLQQESAQNRAQLSREISGELARVQEESAHALAQLSREISSDCATAREEIRDFCAQVGERVDRLSVNLDETGLALVRLDDKLVRHEADEREALNVLAKACGVRLNLEDF
jgi:F0F1-type ATP synthase membrane subunit b/b'